MLGEPDSPTRRNSCTLIWKARTPADAVDCQVSTLTLPRSSACPETVCRLVCRSPEVQRPSTSQLDTCPLALVARTRTSSQVSLGVSADHDGISSVRSKPGATQGESHEPWS